MPAFLKKDNSHLLLLSIIFLLVLLLGVIVFTVPPGVDPDSSWGFMVMQGMEHGNHFNLLVSPNPADIAKNQSEFLAWWSPGQYLAPYFFKVLLKISTGQAVVITVTCCYLIGLTGFYRLFRQLGFTKWVAVFSIAFIASQQFFIGQFLYYTGGEVLLFAFIGWFIYGCFSFKKVSWKVLLFVFFSGLLGFFSKSSVLWMYAAGLACLWICISADKFNGIPATAPGIKKASRKSGYSKEKLWRWLRNGALIAIPAIAALGVIYFFYLSKGGNPASATGKFLFTPEAIGYPLASPLLSGFSIDELLHGLIYQPDEFKISYHSAIILLVILSLCSLAYLIVILKFSPYKKHTLAMFVFYLTGVVFFGYMFLKQSAISFEGRHFRIIGLLFIPGIVYLLFKTKISTVVFFVIWIAFIVIAVDYFRDEYHENKQAARNTTGLSEQLYDNNTMNEIAKLDQAHHNDAIFVVTSPDIASEIDHNRVITLEADEMTTHEISNLKYAGKAGTVYILMPAEYVTNGKSAGIVKCFVAYHHFTSKQLSLDYYLYSATD